MKTIKETWKQALIRSKVVWILGMLFLFTSLVSIIEGQTDVIAGSVIVTAAMFWLGLHMAKKKSGGGGKANIWSFNPQLAQMIEQINSGVLPTVNASNFVEKDGEVAHLTANATRLIVKNQNATSFYNGILTITNRRVIFTATQHGFSATFKTIIGVTDNGTRMIIQTTDNKSYILEIPIARGRALTAPGGILRNIMQLANNDN